jgi:PAT family beta-lactamase induction signal transducer AmpG
MPLFLAVMGFDDFSISMAGITLVAYMSSLTSLGYTATQYALLSSTYAWAGKILKGFSGTIVESLSGTFGLMHAYAVFFVGAGLIGIPAIMLFYWLAARHRLGLKPA